VDASMLANAVSQRAAWALVPRPLNYGLSDAVSTHVTPRNGSVSISGTDGMFVAYGTLSRSFVLRHRAQMLANAVSRRAAWVLLVLQPMNYRLSDTVSARVAPRNDGACVSGADGAHEALETLRSSFTWRHHAWMQANAVSQRAARVLMLAVAELPLERCCIGARCAQKWWRMCFGGKSGA